MAQVKSYRYTVVERLHGGALGGKSASGIPRRVGIRRNDDAEDRSGTQLGGNRLCASGKAQRLRGTRAHIPRHERSR